MQVPIGFPIWAHWEQVPGSLTYRVVDKPRGKMWLFRHLQFKSAWLTPGLLAADEPWFYEEQIDPITSTRYNFAHPAFRILKVDGDPVIKPRKEHVITWPNGHEQVVTIPDDFPPWHRWKVVSGTKTFQVVDLAANKLWLYRQHTFQQCPLTQSILDADDPWFHQDSAAAKPQTGTEGIHQRQTTRIVGDVRDS